MENFELIQYITFSCEEIRSFDKGPVEFSQDLVYKHVT